MMHEMMVAQQIEARGITNSNVLAAMRKVERHLFVPEHLQHLAYGDHPLPIGEGQTISQPYIVALMTLVIEPDENMKVLEIGTGSGYQAAILAELCKSVYSVEIVEVLGKRAKSILADLYDNVFVKTGDGYQGWSEHAPFDAVIVTCSPTHVPKPLVEQLVEGGKIVIPVDENGAQELVLLVKKDGEMVRKNIIPVRFVPMVDGSGDTY
ncbi:MAG: protein-L-isoaspartate(D-aspartate) O-methyltransferase [Lentisphaerae bacterium]|nr:protein-L-isoaspartate(D-aspartate) O-methyltransferase [Lentisphaerota bacterium]